MQNAYNETGAKGRMFRISGIHQLEYDPRWDNMIAGTYSPQKYYLEKEKTGDL